MPAIRNLQASRSLPLDDDIAVPRAQLDLPNMSTGAVNLLGDQRRALPAPELFTFRDVAATMDAESPGRGIEVGLQHERIVLLSLEPGIVAGHARQIAHASRFLSHSRAQYLHRTKFSGFVG